MVELKTKLTKASVDRFLKGVDDDGSCLQIKRLADVDLAVLEALVSASVKNMKQKRG